MAKPKSNSPNKVLLAKDGDECHDLYNDEFREVTETEDSRKRQKEHTQQKPFDAVILDHRMPKMNGLEVAKKIISINPHQRIIIDSSYDGDIFKEAADYFNLPTEVLQKPFSRFSLLSLLEDDRAV